MALATHSSILAWKIPWTEEPGRLQSTGSQRVGHDWATSLPFPLGGTSGKESAYQHRRHKKCRFDPWVRKIPWSRKRQPTSVFLSGEFHGQRAWQATVHGAVKSRTQLNDWKWWELNDITYTNIWHCDWYILDTQLAILIIITNFTLIKCKSITFVIKWGSYSNTHHELSSQYLTSQELKPALISPKLGFSYKDNQLSTHSVERTSCRFQIYLL